MVYSCDELLMLKEGLDEMNAKGLLDSYDKYGLASRSCERLLEVTEMGMSPITRLDAEEATRMKPGRGDLLEALIAAAVKRHDAIIWTGDRDFLKFRPKARMKPV